MKQTLKELYKGLYSPVLYSIVHKVAMVGGVLFLGKVFAEWRSALPESVLENGCFFLAVWFFFWGWIQYLILDGARFFSLMKTRKEELTDEFTDGERAIIRLCSDIVTGIIFLIVYGVLCYIG